MKKTISFIVLLLSLMIPLSACNEKLEKFNVTDGTTTAPTQDTTTGTEPEATIPTETDEQASTELNTAEDVEKFIKENKWYLRALGCVFEKPEDIPARLYFYLGVGADTQATGEELAFIQDAFRQKNPKTENLDYAYNYMRLPVAKMNEALTILGVTVEDIQIPDNWAYNEKLDCYYFWVSDAYGVTNWSVTNMEKGDDGKITVNWETGGSIQLAPGNIVKDAKMVLTMQRQPDGTFRVLSNVPQK